MSVVCGTALESTAVAHHSIGEQLAEDEKEVSADDILRGVVEIGCVYLCGYLDKTAFFLHLRNEVVGCLIGRSHHDFVVQQGIFFHKSLFLRCKVSKTFQKNNCFVENSPNPASFLLFLMSFQSMQPSGFCKMTKSRRGTHC